MRLAFAWPCGPALWCASPAHAASCEDLAKLALPATAITSTEVVAKGAFVASARAAARSRGSQCRSARASQLRVGARVLPRHGDADAVERFRHQDRSVAARRRAGTASSRRSATAAGPARIRIPALGQRRRRAATRAPAPTPATRATPRRSRSAIRKSWSTSAIAPCTR